MAKKRGKTRTEIRIDEGEPDEISEETVEGSQVELETETGDPEEGYLDQLQRLQAEFSNYRKRIAKERIAWDDRAKGEILRGLLPVLDDSDRARVSVGTKPGAKDVEGLLLILGRLEEQLRLVGLERQSIEPGMPFDPDHHEAIMAEPSEEHPEGTIIDTVQPGYLYRGILLRPGRVRVSSGEQQLESAPMPEEGSEAREE